MPVSAGDCTRAWGQNLKQGKQPLEIPPLKYSTEMYKRIEWIQRCNTVQFLHMNPGYPLLTC